MQFWKERKQMNCSMCLSKAVQSSHPAFATLCLPPAHQDGLAGPTLLAHGPLLIHAFGCPTMLPVDIIHVIDQSRSGSEDC